MQATSCRAGECSQEDRCKPPLGPLTHAAPAFPWVSEQADSAKLEPGSVREGAKGQKRAPPAKARRSAPGLPAGWELLRPSARSCLGEGLTRRPEPRPARRAVARGAAATVACAWGAGAPTHPGRPPPPPPPRPPPRRSILRRGACSRGARVTTAGRAGPSPPPNVCPQGRSADPASAAAALRGRRSDVSRLPSERARPSGARWAGGARGGSRGGGVRVWMCVQRGGQGGRESGGESARARARGPFPLRPPRPTGIPTPPSARPLGIPAAGSGGAHAQPLGPALVHLFSLLPHCERSAAQITADYRSTPALPHSAHSRAPR